MANRKTPKFISPTGTLVAQRFSFSQAPRQPDSSPQSVRKETIESIQNNSSFNLELGKLLELRVELSRIIEESRNSPKKMDGYPSTMQRTNPIQPSETSRQPPSMTASLDNPLVYHSIPQYRRDSNFHP